MGSSPTSDKAENLSQYDCGCRTGRKKTDFDYVQKQTMCVCSVCVTCHFKTFGRFETAMAVLIPLRGLEMAWPFRNGQLFPLAVLIPHQFDIGGQVCSVAFKCNSCNTIKTYIFIGTAFGLL